MLYKVYGDKLKYGLMDSKELNKLTSWHLKLDMLQAPTKACIAWCGIQKNHMVPFFVTIRVYTYRKKDKPLHTHKQKALVSAVPKTSL